MRYLKQLPSKGLKIPESYLAESNMIIGGIIPAEEEKKPMVGMETLMHVGEMKKIEENELP